MINKKQVISDLKQIKAQTQVVEILHFYKGLPVTSNTHIQRIEDETVILKVEPPNSVCLEWEDTIWLMLGEPLGAVACSVLSLIFWKGLHVWESGTCLI